MSESCPIQVLSEQDVRDAGGIVHRDGNVFFTNIDKLNEAILAKLADKLKDAERYAWLRELPNADSLNVKFMGSDLDSVINAAIDAQKGIQ